MWKVLPCNFTPIYDMTAHTYALRWRHNGCKGVSNHQPNDCLLKRLFRRRSKEVSKLRVTGLREANSPVNSPHKGPVTRKMFPFDDVIMYCTDMYLFIHKICIKDKIYTCRSVWKCGHPERYDNYIIQYKWVYGRIAALSIWSTGLFIYVNCFVVYFSPYIPLTVRLEM